MAPTQPLSDRVENFVHEPTQVHDDGVDLTVSAIYRVTEPGRMAFDADDMADAGLEPVTTQKRPDELGDERWELEGGQYVLQYNEFLVGDARATLYLQPRNDLLARGVTHPSILVRTHLPLVSISVPDGGITITENARVSTLLSPTGADTDETNGR